MRSLVLAVTVALTTMCALAQSDAALLGRDKRIKEHLANKSYEKAIAEIDAQVASATGTPWQDSLWSYIYPLGSAHWRVHGDQAAAAASEQLYQRIAAAKRSPQWEVKALIKISALYYDLSFMEEYERVGKLALATAERNAGRIPPLILADANYCMGLTQMDLGRDDLALPHIERAISLARGISPLPIGRLPTYFSGQGSALRGLGRNREAEESYRQGIAVAEQDTSLEGASMRATLLGNWAILIQATGDLHRSKDINTRALQEMNAVIARTASDPQEQFNARANRTRILLNLASTYFDMADFDRAGDLLKMAQVERRELFGGDHPKVTDLNEAIAEVEAMAGNYERAEALLTEQITVLRASNANDAEGLLNLHSRLARMAAKQGDLVRSDSILAVVLPKDDREVGSSASKYLATAFAERADLRIAQGRHAEAIRDLLISRGIRSRIYGSKHERLAEADVVISGAALAMGDTLMARQFADSAMLLLSDRIALAQGPFAPTALRYPGLLSDAVMAKVCAERAAHPGSGAEREWLRQLDLAFGSLQRNTSSLSDDGSRLQMAGSTKQLFDLGLELAHAAHERYNGAADLDRFLRISESDRSILLKAHLNAFTSLRYSSVPDSVLEREQHLLKALHLDPEDRAAWEELHAKEVAYAAFLDTLRAHHPQYFALRYGEPQVTIADLRKRLVTTQRNVLSYATTKDHLYMLVVRMDTAALVRVSSKGLNEAVERLNSGIGARNTLAYIEAAHALYKMVFAPVESLLTEKELLIIPDGALHKVNFEALLVKPDAKDFRQNLLIQRYAIAYLLSATTAVQFSELDQHRATGVLAMAPGFDDELKQRYTSTVSDTAQLDRDYLRYVRQPFALSSAQGLGDLLSAKVMVRGEASEKHFRELAREYGILHLGTHAEMNGNAPMYSRFILSKESDDLDAAVDGYLHAYEIYELDLRAQLAVLTACETGAGRNDDGEGVRSLGYSFAYAGCPSLVVSLWNIDEKVSSEIITRFYEHLANGLPKHMALRQAKLDHLNNATDELALPYYWAGMVLVGDVAPVQVGTGAIRYAWLALGALAITLAVVLLLRRRKVRNAPSRE
jgi:CHAT domain-containing protein